MIRDFFRNLFIDSKMLESKLLFRPGELTWRCDICHDERPDANIHVITYVLSDLPGAERNLKYCEDRPTCVEGAIERAKARTI